MKEIYLFPEYCSFTLLELQVGQEESESKKTKNPADLEIIIDLDLARKCLIKGAQWPLLANKQGRNGDLREKDNNITLNGPR